MVPPFLNFFQWRVLAGSLNTEILPFLFLVPVADRNGLASTLTPFLLVCLVTHKMKSLSWVESDLMYSNLASANWDRSGALLYQAFHHPAVHIDGLAGDEFCLIRCQKSNNVCYILRVTVVAQRNVLFGEPFHDLWG